MTIDEERAVNFFFANLRLKKKVCIREERKEESADEREKKRRKQKQKQKNILFILN